MTRPPPKGTRFPSRIEKEIDELIKRGEFEGYSDFIHTAVTHYLYYREVREMKEILMGKEGLALLREIIHDEVQERKQRT